MIKLICIRDVYQAKEGEVYYTDEDYFLLKDTEQLMYVNHSNGNILGIYKKKYFLSESEFREKQIKSVLDDN